MDTKLLIIFIVLNAINVILNTIKSLCTINGGKFVASTMNAITYGFYTIVVIYLSCDLPMLWKVLIVGAVNFIGVWIVKWVEEKARKDKLWKVELTVNNERAAKLHSDLDSFGVPHNFITGVGKWTIFNCYCATQKESAFVKEVATRNRAKFFVSETKNL